MFFKPAKSTGIWMKKKSLFNSTVPCTVINQNELPFHGHVLTESSQKKFWKRCAKAKQNDSPTPELVPVLEDRSRSGV